MSLVNDIMKTYHNQVKKSVVTRLNNNKLQINIELTIKKDQLAFIKSLINSD